MKTLTFEDAFDAQKEIRESRRFVDEIAASLELERHGPNWFDAQKEIRESRCFVDEIKASLN